MTDEPWTYTLVPNADVQRYYVRRDRWVTYPSPWWMPAPRRYHQIEFLHWVATDYAINGWLDGSGQIPPVLCKWCPDRRGTPVMTETSQKAYRVLHAHLQQEIGQLATKCDWAAQNPEKSYRYGENTGVLYEY